MAWVTVMPLVPPRAPLAPLRIIVPPLMVVAPVYMLLLDRLSVPEPPLVTDVAVSPTHWSKGAAVADGEVQGPGGDHRS